MICKRLAGRYKKPAKLLDPVVLKEDVIRNGKGDYEVLSQDEYLKGFVQ